MPRSTLPRLLSTVGPPAGGIDVEEDAMEIMHERVAGLDVHKATIVGCVRVQVGREVRRECRTFATTTDGLVALLGWLTTARWTHVAMAAPGVYWRPAGRIVSE